MRIARGFRARLIGLTLRRAADEPLLIPRCRSVHTAGMRFAIDVVFLDARGRVVRVAPAVRPWRLVSCRRAVAVVETAAGEAGIITAMPEDQRERLLAGLDPRTPLYRDAYNEYFMLILSAGGAAAGTQVPLYILMAITGLWGVLPFMAACVIFELAVIFGLARPQMKPVERIGWAALWSGATAVLAVCFYYLVAKPTL
jgi:uncharacterized membrane protein (UPF0127 family)